MRIRSVIAATILGFAPIAGMADDFMPDMKDVHFTAGVRVWRTDWSTWGNLTTNDYQHAELRYSVIPVVSVSYRNLFVSGSYQAPGTFKFKPNTTLSGTSPFSGFEFRRREYDLNFGYFIVPGLAVTAGWKNVRYEEPGSTYRWTAKGPTIGASGNAPVADWVSLYGNIGYGRPKVDDLTHFHSQRGKYLLTEFGFAFPLGPHANALTGAVLTAGYRYQRIGAYPSTALFSSVEVFETAQGPVAGFAMRF
jgi:opacity protein-like surface antigen